MYGFYRWDPTTERIAPGHRANSSVHKTHPKEHGGAKNRPDSIDEWSQTRHFHTDAVCNEGDSGAWHSSTCLIRNKLLHSVTTSVSLRCLTFWTHFGKIMQNHQGHCKSVLLSTHFLLPSALWALQNAEYSVMTKTTSNPKCEHGHSLLDCRYCLMWPLNSYWRLGEKRAHFLKTSHTLFILWKSCLEMEAKQTRNNTRMVY